MSNSSAGLRFPPFDYFTNGFSVQAIGLPDLFVEFSVETLYEAGVESKENGFRAGIGADCMVVGEDFLCCDAGSVEVDG